MKSTSWSSKRFVAAVISAVVAAAAVVFFPKSVLSSTSDHRFDGEDSEKNDGFLVSSARSRINTIINRYGDRRSSSPSSHHWSPNCPPSLNPLGSSNINDVDSRGACCCSITDYGAIGDNSTLNTVAIQTTIDTCVGNCFHDAQPRQQPSQAIVYVPRGMFQTGSLWLRSNVRFHIGKGASIYGSDDPADYPIVPMKPNGYETHKQSMFRALFAGYDLDNVSITGENYGYPPGSLARFLPSSTNANIENANRSNDTNLSVIDGVGWKWWCKARSMPVPQAYCEEMNPNNETIPSWRMRPKLIEFYNSTNIVFDRFTARNSPVWTIHSYLSKNIVMTNLTVLAPRSVGNTDGLDPDSCENVLMDSCYIDVGDDGVSIKSTNHSGTFAPTRNITMRNLRIVSRNWCIGSATFGGVYDILFEDSTIGDPDTITSPWGIKFKSHRYYPGPMENITIRRIEMGRIGPTPYMYPTIKGAAFLLGLGYGKKKTPDHRSGKPLFRNVTLEDITVASADIAGQIVGFPEDCLQGLTLRNISVRGGTDDWRCEKVDLDSLEISDVYPPVTCKGGCVTATAVMAPQ
mmetsp:Transcript_27325/g.64038  ORF Transcript_27325/g.64038 Transcript_27325/m.64038 type:complete len:575 (+) Transcript_27325:49-1773(+)